MKASWSVVLMLVAFVAVACGHKPPYTLANKPSTEQLLQAAQPQLSAIAVSDATIVLNRIARGDLAMLAQAPQRFRASVSKAGNELVTLAFNEEDYGLRYLLDDMPTGFYSGPANPCAVEAILGVPLSYEDLVAAVLGGAPVIPNYTVLKQKWDRKQGLETLLIGNDRFIQALEFDFVDGHWRFISGGLWKRAGKERGDWLWSIEHSKHEPVGTASLPGRTEVRSPKTKRGKNVVIINYKARDPNPPWAKAAGGESGATDDGEGGEEEGGADDWGDDDDWEDEEPAPAEMPEPEPEPEPESGVKTAPETAAQSPEKSNIPAPFRLEASGLQDRGDLCR